MTLNVGGDELDNRSLVCETHSKSPFRAQILGFVNWGRMAPTALAHSVALGSAGISRGICQVQGPNHYSVVFATTCRIRPAQLTRKFRPFSARSYSICPCLKKEIWHETKGKREATPPKATAKTTEKSKVSEKVTEGEPSCKIARLWLDISSGTSWSLLWHAPSNHAEIYVCFVLSAEL